MKISPSKLKTLLTIGENLNIEFKRAGDGPKADTFESVCAFLNKAGGDLLLGVDDDSTVVGLTRGVSKDHFIRAAVESLAYQTNDLISAMKEESGLDISSLKVDGGASANNFLMQFQADIIGAPVNRPVCVETTAMGAAYLAGLAVGYWTSKEDVKKNWAFDRIFKPEMSAADREEHIKGWKKAVKCSFGWAKED